MALTTEEKLDKAVSEAADKVLGKEEETEKEEVPEVTLEVSEEDKEEETSKEDEEISEDESKEALNLYKALKNPKSASAIIAALAQQVGLLGSQRTEEITKREVKEGKKEIKAILAEALGKEYSFLADKFGPAIEKILEQERSESNERFAKMQQAQVEREVNTAYEKLAVETKGESKRLENRMAQLSEEIPIGTMDVKTYMKRLYAIASAERQTPPKKIAAQINKNSTDVGSRLRSGAATTSNGIEIPKGKMSLNDSVNFAVDTILRESNLKK